MTMARPAVPKEQKLREGAFLSSQIDALFDADGVTTQESLAHEMGVTQGLVSQWCTGNTAIPDRRLLWLADRLDFDCVTVRPSLASYSGNRSGSSGAALISALYDRLNDEGKEALLKQAELVERAHRVD